MRKTAYPCSANLRTICAYRISFSLFIVLDKKMFMFNFLNSWYYTYEMPFQANCIVGMVNERIVKVGNYFGLVVASLAALKKLVEGCLDKIVIAPNYSSIQLLRILIHSDFAKFYLCYTIKNINNTMQTV